MEPGDTCLSTLTPSQHQYFDALHETTLGLLKRLDTETLLRDIVKRAADLMHTEHGYVYLLDPVTARMNIEIALGAFELFAHRPLALGEGIAGHVWESGHPLTVENYSMWGGRLPGDERNMLRAVAGLPLSVNGSITGVIGLAYLDETSRFDDEKQEILYRFAQLASVALEHVTLYESLQKELEERKRIEERLRTMFHIVEQSPVSILITDTSGTIEYANPHFTLLTGYSIEELTGKNPRILKSGQTSDEEYHLLWETILQGNQWSGEFQNKKKNGDLYWEKALISPLRDIQGTITHFIAIKEDISEQKVLENQLRYAQKMEAVGQMAGGVAHDFNNILTAVIGYANIVSMKLPKESDLLSTLAKVISSAERGAELTRGLLAFSRKLANNPIDLDLNQAVSRAEKMMRRSVGGNISISSSLHPEPLLLHADSMQLEQILMHLAQNARDAMPGGGRIRIATSPVCIDNDFIALKGFGVKGNYAELTFTDSGCGIAPELVPRIFEPFFTTKETGKGTGIGLSIVYGIIKKHNGFIICQSRQGEGTTFKIYLPLLKKSSGTIPHPPVPSSTDSGGATILLAEDDQTTREIAVEIMESFGYRVITAADGNEAVEKYLAHRDILRLVILDSIMPGMNGRDVYQKIVSLDLKCPVIFCSGYGDEALEGIPSRTSHLSCLPKPFTPRELLAKTQEALKLAKH